MKLYQNNRKKLVQALPDGLILVASADHKVRNNDVYYRFRQDSDFLYLTSIENAGHALLLDGKTKKSYLFIPDIDRHHQVWEGRLITASEAKKLYKVDFAYHMADFDKVFKELSRKSKKLYALETGLSLLKNRKLTSKAKADVKTLREALDELRVRKTPEEIEMMKKAAAISYHAHIEAMKATRAGLYEYQVQAVLEKEFLNGGASHYAYSSIVASGANAAILHYKDNNMLCHGDDLLLIDAGCEWHGYASDITRTFPVNGHFNSKQRDIYSVVLRAQKECIEMVKPGLSMIDLHNHACRVIVQGLMDLGIYNHHPIEEIIQEGAHRIFFPHGLGHLLGLDVHDVGARDPKIKLPKNKPQNLRTTRMLEPGFVVTVEPGIYFIEAFFSDKETRKKTAKYINWKKAEEYRSVGGIRIEDDVLVTKSGYENLTFVPKEIEEIERVMNENRMPKAA